MFVGWLRKNSFQNDLEEFAKSRTVDKNLILNSVFHSSTLAAGAYDGDILKAFITAYGFDSTVLINNFYYQDKVGEDIQKRVLNVLLDNIEGDGKTVLFLARYSEKKLLEESGFKVYGKFKKAVYSGGGVSFNFTNATAKRISGENYVPIINKIDKKCFKENRTEYVTKKMFKTSSLLLSTDNGYQHSYGVNKNLIKISPWIMESGAYDDAEKIMRGVIYHRGLKQIVSFIPESVKEITDLYQSYKFELVEDFYLMYKNKKPDISLEMIYGF